MYIRHLVPLSSNATFSDFASLRMKLEWLAHTRPDVLFEVSQLTQIKTHRFKEDSKEIIKRANTVLKYAKDNIVSVKFPSLDV